LLRKDGQALLAKLKILRLQRESELERSSICSIRSGRNPHSFACSVKSCWTCRESRLRAGENTRNQLQTRMADQSARLSQLDDAFIYRRAIDRQTYEAERDRLREQRCPAEIELNESQNEALDVEGLLAFAENALINPGSLWSSSTVAVKQGPQWVFFPQG